MATKKSKSKKVKPIVKKALAKPVKSKAVKPKPIKTAEKKAPTKAIGKVTKAFSKSEIYSTIADGVELNRKQVAAVFDMLGEIIAAHLKKDGPEKFMLPELLKIVVKKVPAKPAREGINPFTKEPTTFKAKPASKKIKVIALRGLKDLC
jgi:nucleoid DNA-binding protein